jgi:YD repeat-containing protein
MGYTVHYAYNKDNRIKTFTDAEGYSTHISYNDDGMAHRVKTDVTDKSIRYELAKRQTIFIDYLPDANNQYSKYVWDEQGRLVEILNVNTGASTKFAYDDDNNLISREDANGNAYTYTYDENGNQLSATDPLGYTESYTYEDTFNKVTSYTDKKGNYYNFQYDQYGDLLHINGPLNYSLSMTYNEYGQPLSTTDANGNTSHYGYDSFGNLISMTDPMGYVTTLTYNSAGLPLTQTKPDGAVSTLVYDRNECLVETIDALNFSIQMQYDRKGNMVGYIDALNNNYTLSYDAIGQLVSSISPDGAHSRFYYSGNRMSRIVDALNHEKRLIYGDNNQLAMSINAINETTRRSYDNVGNLIGVSLANGDNIVYQYDVLGRLESASDQMGTFFVYHYDANNNVIQKEDALGHSDYYIYDALNRLIQHTDAMGNSEYLSYDNNGNLLTFLDMNGNATIRSYDAKGRLSTHTDAMNYVTSYNYDFNNNPLSVTDANGNTTTYEYDLLRQLKKVTFPNGKTRRFWYDGKGNITKQENEAGEQTNLTYDAVDRLIEVHSVDRSNEYSLFQYDLVGNLIGATNSNATSTFTRDALGRLLSEEINGVLTSYSYNTAERTIGVTYPSGKQVLETHDFRSQTTGIYVNGGAVASFEYNNAGAILSRNYANGAVTNYSYDDLGRLNHLYDNHNIMNYQFVYDALDNIVARKDLINSENSQAFSYDALDRLIDYQTGIMNDDYLISAPMCHVSYGLDALGNRTDVIENGVTTQYTINAMNAYTSIVGPGSNQILVYDDEGNMTSDGIHTYQYDINNRRISVDNGNSAVYKYDALGRLIQSQFPSDQQTTIENYCYAGQRMIEQKDGTGNLISSHVFGLNASDALQSTIGNSQYYLQKDQTGSIVALIDGNASLLEKYNYDAFGNVSFYDGNSNAINGSSFNNQFLYGGRYIDDLTMTYQFHGQTYNPVQGRMSEVNKSLFANSMNLYSKDVDNPVKVLLTGLNTISEGLKGVGRNPGMIKESFGGFGYNGQINIGSNGKLYFETPKGNIFHGNQYVSVTSMDDVLGTINYVGKVIGTITTVASALCDTYDYITNYQPTETLAEEGENAGRYGGGVIGGYLGGSVGGIGGAAIGAALGTLLIPIPGIGTAIGAFVGGMIGGYYGGKAGRYLGQEIGGYSGRGWGMMGDMVVNRLERDCERFMQNGYDNSSIMQQTFADVVNHPFNVVGNAWNLGKRLFNFGYKLGEKWFPVN